MSQTHFLLVFDRAEGRLLSITPFAERAEALRARFATEKVHRQNPSIEVVVLTAPSESALRRTHSRYFESFGEMARHGIEKVKGIRRIAAEATGGDHPGFAV